MCVPQSPYVEVLPGVSSRLIHCDEHIVVIETRLAPGAMVPRHSHESLQISFCVKGRMELVIGNEKVLMTPGSYRVIPPRVEHEARALEETVVVDVNSPLTEDRKELIERLGGCRTR